MTRPATVGCILAGSLVFGALAPAARAERTRFFDLEGFGEFLDGNPETTSVTEDGAVTLPPAVRERFADPALTFTAATARGDDVIVARADDAQILAIDSTGKTRPIFKPQAALVTALAYSRAGLFVATAKPAKIYVVDDAGRASDFYTPKAEYVWGMAEGPSGSLLCVTGEPATVVRLEAKGKTKGEAKAEVLFTAEHKHLRSIVYDASLGVFVGGGDRGVVYRAAKGNDFRALFDSGHPEITSLVTRDGRVYVAAVTGAQALAASEAPSGKSDDGKHKSDESQVRSQLVRVAMDGAAEVLAGSSDEAIFALAIDDKGQVLVATGATGREDPRGRLYTVDPKSRLIAMVYQSPSRRITHLLALPKTTLAAVAGSGGRVVQIAGGLARQGEFVTKPFDTGINARLGSIEVSGQWPSGTKVVTSVRTGQTAHPDTTWSDWSKPVEAPGGKPITVANGRHLQVRLTLQGDGKATPIVYRVRVAYRRQNLPPFVREVAPLRRGLALLPMVTEESKSKTISLGEKASEAMRRGEDDDEERTRKGERARQVEQPGALTVKWIADDPNGDDLRYDVSYRAVGQTEWHLLKGELDSPFYTFQSAQLPDGHYQFKVLASDAPSNPEGDELSDTRESRAVLIDNSPPRLDPLAVSVKGKSVTIRVVAADAVGPLVRAEYAMDAKRFRPATPDDGLLDEAGESFGLQLGPLAPGRHTLTFRIADEAENEAVGSAAFTIP